MGNGVSDFKQSISLTFQRGNNCYYPVTLLDLGFDLLGSASNGMSIR